VTASGGGAAASPGKAASFPRALRVLAIPSAVGFAHVARALLVAKRLAERSHEVTFAFGGADATPIRGAGFSVVPCPDRPADPHVNVYSAWTEDDAEHSVREQVRLIRELTSDVVIADFHPTATIAAQAAGVPSAALVPATFVPGAELLTGARGIRADIARAVLTARERPLAAPFAAAARRRSQRHRGTLAGVFRGDASLVTELASFVGFERLPHGYRWIGPLIFEEGADPPGAVPAPLPGTARVYATIGNTGDPRLLEITMEALAGLPGIQLVLTSGRLVPRPVPPSDAVVCARTLPGGEIMRASHLAIHPGGSGTTYQALAAGVPMVVVPAISGQAPTARLVSRHGVGTGYRLDRLTPERLRVGAAALILDERARGRARAFAAELAAVDGPGAAAAAVEALAAGHATSAAA
jgi:UDP:flavonoid glycosyltransferase YjiC (YdhE family)